MRPRPGSARDVGTTGGRSWRPGCLREGLALRLGCGGADPQMDPLQVLIYFERPPPRRRTNYSEEL